MYNRRLFGVPVHHIVWSDSVWNSLGLCSNSSSNSRSSSCSNSSSKSSSSSSSSRHLAPACSGMQCITAAARQARADPIGSQADQRGRFGEWPCSHASCRIRLGSGARELPHSIASTVQLKNQLFSLRKLHIIEPLKSCPEATTCLYQGKWKQLGRAVALVLPQEAHLSGSWNHDTHISQCIVWGAWRGDPQLKI